VLRRFPWVDVIARGEGEVTGPELMQALNGGELAAVQGISYRKNGSVAHNPDRPRIRELDTLGLDQPESKCKLQ